mgnify:CR=1 FL=1
MAVQREPNLSPGLRQQLARIVGAENCLTGPVARESYAYDSTPGYRAFPAAVVLPASTEEVAKVVRLCAEAGLGITPRGAGTNLSGGTVPVKGGVVVCFTRMQKIVSVDAANQTAVVEPGVITARFHQVVEAQGLFFPPDPGSQSVSTLGGNVAENAGGLRGLKYGVTRDYVLGLEAVLADGSIIQTGSETLKNVTGYNLTQLLCGSEGTLALFTKLILRLVPRPPARRSFLAYFADIQRAAATVPALVEAGVLPATLEIMDRITLQAVEDFAHLGLPGGLAAMLLIEVDGQPAQVEAEAATVEVVLSRSGASEWQAARDESTRNRIWSARRAALAALSRRRPATILEDVTVPRRQIPAMFATIQSIASRYQLEIGTFGHAGDGNLHPTILCDLRDRKEINRVEAAVAELFDAALSLGGVLSGEHGIGLAKNRFLHRQLGQTVIILQRDIKRTFDPQGLLNPGKALGVIP